MRLTCLVRRFVKSPTISLFPILACVLAHGAEIHSGTLPNSSETLITIEGKIDYGDDRKFLDAALSVPNAVVALSSPGGNLDAGLLVGRVIRRLHFTTVVAPDTVCASACAIAWLGGTRRVMSDTSKVGFHAAYIEQDGKTSESGMANALVGAFLNEIGLQSTAVRYVTQAAPDDIQWLSFADAKSLGIDVIRFEDLGDGQSTKVVPSDRPSESTSGVQRVYWRVRANVSEGIQNVREGPGKNYRFLFSMPAGARGIELGDCQPPVKGGGRFDWCIVKWQGRTGWSSSNGFEVDLAQR